MNRDEETQDDKLWNLLGKAPQPQVSPFFARNVLRAIRQEEPAGAWAGFARKLRRARRWTWKLALAGTCAIAALLTIHPVTVVRHVRPEQQSLSVAPQIVTNPDYDTIKHLDELVADEESSVWLDDSAASTVN